MYSTSLFHGANSARNGAAIRVASVVAAAFALASASGCALLSDNLEKAARGAGKVVTAYCENVTVPEVRAEIANAVNAKAAPHKVEVTCADEVASPTTWNFRDLLQWFERSPILVPEAETANG